jgi:hypothetical protein
MPKDSGVMKRKNPYIAREKRASLFVQSENSVCRGKIRLLGFFRKQQYMRKQPFTNKVVKLFVSQKTIIIA